MLACYQQFVAISRVFIVFLLAFFGPATSFAQSPPWLDVPQGQVRSLTFAERLIEPQRYRTVSLDWVGLDGILQNAPMESLQRISSTGVVLSLPLADGSFGRFRVEVSPIMDAVMAASLPDVKTYRGVGIDDPSAVVRFDTTPAGFHAMIRSDKGIVFIDPYARGNTDLYIVYDKRHYNVQASERPVCRVGDPAYVTNQGGLPPLDFDRVPGAQTNAVQNGATFKTIRLAVAATGEYTGFHGGTVASAQAAIITTINRVNVVYEHDLAIRMILVDNAAIVFTNPGPGGPNEDPYSNTCNGAELVANQTTIDNAIGAGSYDLGHVMGGPGGGGGIAAPGPCLVGVDFGAGPLNSHARGCTGLNNPVGDPFDIDFVAHEIGHQWGAPHTFNGLAGNCTNLTRASGSAYEPGSGSTIMAYAGTCGAHNLQANSDAYFHGSSLEAIAGFDPTDYGAINCIQEVASSNAPPIADANVNNQRTIPMGTPFKLCGNGTDLDGDRVTFLWEEYDLGPDPGGPPDINISPPFFRSFSPVAKHCRTFPKLNDILTNTQTIGEILPIVETSMTFRLTVFDNAPGAMGGGFDQDEVIVTVDDAAGPFRITSQNDVGVEWSSTFPQSLETVTWDVAETTEDPIFCSTVNLRYSADGGQTFPTLLATGTANDGTESIFVPAGATSFGRIKVECVNNIFFDINDANITVDDGGGCSDDNFETPWPGNTFTDDTCYGSPLGSVPAGPQTHLHCDEDWVYFNAKAGTTYNIKTSNLVGGADTVISVHDMCGPALATDDNSGADGKSSELQFTANTNGALDIRITEAGNLYGPGKGYDISVSEIGGCPVDLVLANQMVTDSQVFIAQNQIVTGPDFVVSDTGDATLTAGTKVVLGNDTSVSGSLTVNLTPNPCSTP